MIKSNTVASGGADSLVASLASDAFQTPGEALKKLSESNGDSSSQNSSTSATLNRAGGSNTSGFNNSSSKGATVSHTALTGGSDSSVYSKSNVRDDVNPLTGNASNGKTLGRDTYKDSQGRLLDSLELSPQDAWVAFLCTKIPSLSDLPSVNDLNYTFDLNSLWLRSTGCTALNLLDFVNLGTVSVDTKDGFKRRLGTKFDNSITTLPDSLIGRLINKLKAVDESNQSVSTDLVDGELVVKDNTSRPDTATNQSTLNAISDNVKSETDTVDEDVEFVVIDTMLETALTDPDIDLVDVTTVIDQIENPAVRTKVLLGRLRYAAKFSKIEFINYVLDELGSDAVRYSKPRLTEWIVSDYTSTYRNSTITQQGVDLIAVLDRVDPEWHTDGSESDLTLFVKSSLDASKVFKSTEYKINAYIALGRSVSTQERVLGNMYPRVSVG